MVVEQGLVTRAARKLKISQPALSLSLSRLEKALHKKLFQRAGKRLTLTQKGQNFYQTALKIVKLWQNAKEGEQLAAFAIGLFDNAALRLSPMLKKTIAENRFHLEITIDKSQILLSGLQNGIFDLAVAVLPHDEQTHAKITLIKTFSETLFAVSSKIWRGKITDIPFILYNRGSETRHTIDAVFQKHGLKPTVFAESTDPAFMKELAMGGAGVTLLPKNFVKREIANRKLFVQKFPFSFRRKIGVWVSREGTLTSDHPFVKQILSEL